MNKITFPLTMSMKRETVADLHAALKHLNFDVAQEEIEEPHYGETTAAAVRQFQTDHGLRKTGNVDEETAHRLNQRLHEAGSLDEHDSYSIQGRISDQSQNPVPGLLVRAADMDPRGENPLGGPAITDEDGHYAIVYYDHQFRIAGLESGDADVVVRVFDPENRQEPLVESKMHGNVDREVTINLTVAYQPSAQPQPQDGDNEALVVKGRVRTTDGKPGCRLTVKAFDVRLRQDHLLAQDTTDDDGRYEIIYSRKQVRAAGKNAADLRVRAYKNKDEQIAQSHLVFSAGEAEEIDLTIGNTAYRGLSEYEQLVALLEPRLRGLNFAELREDDEHQDVTFLSGNTDADPRLVAFLIAAHRLSARTSIPAEIFYGLFRYDLPVNLPALIVQDPAILSRTLELATTDNIIPSRFSQEIDKLPAQFKKLVVTESMRPQSQKEGASQAPLVALLSTVLADAKDQEEFLERYVNHAGPINEFWEALRTSPQLGKKVDEVQFTLQAAAFTGNHGPLLAELQSLHNDLDPQNKIASVRDLVRFDETGWRKILERANGQGKIGTPPNVPGADENEKLANYAHALTRRAERANPTAFIAARLEDDDLDGKANLVTFFKNNQATFDITGTRLANYVHENPNALDGIADNDKPAVTAQLRAMQRLYNVAPSYAAMSALYKDGIKSAADIIAMGATGFTLNYTNALGSGSDTANAQRVYARAESIHAMAVALLSAHGLDGTHLSLYAIQDKQPEPGPNWPTLFGSLDLCTCEHCRSVYSPAAYLVDLLHFLQERRLVDPGTIEHDDFGHIKPDVIEYLKGPTGEVWTAKDELFARRADLGDIELTCENSNSPMPYVDLINEVLENYVAPQVVTAHSRQTSDSPEELAANPQYLNLDAYDNLRQGVFPFTLPFDLYHEQARVYLSHLGTQRDDLMESFLPGNRATLLANPAIGRERLNLTTFEGDLIIGTFTDPLATPENWTLWGFTQATLDATNPIPDPADSTAWLDVLTGRVDVFLQQSSLTYIEFLALLGSYFVNPGSNINRPITLQAHDGAPVDTCETDSLRIDGMDEDAALRSLRFIRLWRKIGWTMRDLDRALTTLLSLNNTTTIDDVVLNDLSLIHRLHKLLRQPIEKLLPFWGQIDTARYLNHDATGQPPCLTLYERLFRNKNVLNPPDPDFNENPAALMGSLSAHDATVSAALGISVADLTAMRLDVDIIPLVNGQSDSDDDLSLENLSRLYRHATLAKALRLPVADYLTALKLHAAPFTDPAATVLFVEHINAVGASELTLAELDYLSRHRIVEPNRVAPTDEEVSRLLTDLRSELQRIAAEHTFEGDADAPNGSTVDLQGDLTREKLALLGWDSSLIDEVVATLNGGVTYRTDLTTLPPNVALPADMPISHDAAARRLQFTGAMTPNQQTELNNLSTNSDYQDAVTALFNAPRAFVRRNMRCYTIDHFETPLVTLPDNITFPLELKDRVYHDADAESLYFVGAMGKVERAALLDLSANNDYQNAIVALFAAPDTPPATASFLTDNGAGSDTAVLFNDSETTPADRFKHVLSKLMPHLHEMLSERAVIQELAEALGLETQTALDLLRQWLDRTGQAGQKLLATFLDAGFAQSNANIPVTRAVFAEQFDAYLRLQKIALIVERFECTPRQVGWLFTVAAADWPDLALLPVAPQAAPAASLEAWLRLIDLFGLRERLPRAEEMLNDLLVRTALVSALASEADKDAAKEAFVEALAQWTDWPPADLNVLLGAANDHNQTGLLGAAFPGDYASAHLLTRLDACFELLKRLGMSAAQCRDLTTADISQPVSEMVKQAARAKYDEAQWLELARPLRDTLREQQRQALVAYTLAHPDKNHRWRNINDIYSHFLVDVEMDPCMMTSRIKQAISSVQLFVQRCLMNLETNVLASDELDERWREWHWMKNYRVWEANRKIFLYPENWIQPELRDDKTPFFRDLESELLQNNLTHDTAETAFRGYLDKLDTVAHLEIVGMYQERENDAAGKLAVDILHVFGRTAGIPHVYYYRRLNNGIWTAWERVDLDIAGDHLIPIAWQGRLHLIWPILTEEAAPSGSPLTRIRIQLARSEYKNGKWLSKKVSEESTVSRDGFTAADTHRLVFKGHINAAEQLEVSYVFMRPSFQKSSDETPGFLAKMVDDPSAPGGVSDHGPRKPERPSAPDTLGATSDEEAPLEFFRFRLSGCNSDFTLIPENSPTPPVAAFLFPHSMWLREYVADGTLYLPMTTTRTGVALEKTPGSPFRILYPHQRPGLTGLRTGPWFFNDDRHTYFVTVRRPVVVWEDAYEPDQNALKHLFASVPDDPFDPVIGNNRLTPAINPGDLLLFAETTPVPPSASPGDLIVATPLMASNGLRSATSLPLLIARNHLETVSMNTVNIARSRGKYRYTFHTFYHPYLCSLIEALNRNGIDGLLQRPKQLRTDEGATVFEETYNPVEGAERLVNTSYPLEEVDFNQGGAYSPYNWELFFHAPFLIANSLHQNQRFADAQRWFHYIFDPTDRSGLPVPKRYWRTKPFYNKSTEDYQRQQIPMLLRLLASGGDVDKLNINDDNLKAALLADYDDLVAAVKAWRADPFKPHLVARMRTTAYQKTVVMKYIDNLIAWGDQLFRRDTIESINEATQLYIMAADILGKRPEKIPPRAVPVVHTYNTLEPLLGELSNGLAEIEEFVSPSVATELMPGNTPLPSPLTMLYFCVPKNDELLAYWDIVADRLFKIRHCMNIEGAVRQLPLFALPIDPALLVRAADAGIDLNSVLNEVNAALPHYRFNVLAQKATELCGELKSLSGALLATLEKRDAEKLALLRTEHEGALLKLIELVRSQQLEEADQQLAVLGASRESAVGRYMHYQKLLGVQDTQAPPEGEVLPEHGTSKNASTKEEDGVKMISREVKELGELESAQSWQEFAKMSDWAAGANYLLPNWTIPAFFGAESTWGGSNIGGGLSAVASEFRAQANEDSYKANRASRMGQHIMREHDWVLQNNSAAKEIMQIDQQIIAADLRKAIADQELKNQHKQIEQAQKVEETMRDKYTNQELYTWMIGQISTVYFQAYQLAYDVGKRAERAFRHELGLQDSSFIQFGYWDSLKKGLLAGDRLHHDLKRMEVAYLNQNKRELEIIKHVSLRQLDPMTLLTLKATGSCEVTLPEWLFDLDGPGHYMRRIKSVSLSMPSVTGPYTSVNCTLSLLRSTLRRSPLLRNDEYQRADEEDSRFVDYFGTIQSIVTSSAQNDGGMFENNLRDERYLPFEGFGVESTWKLELPTEFRQFDYNTISDVLFHVRFTARQGGRGLGQKATDHLRGLVAVANTFGLVQLFSLKHDFPSEWHRFVSGDGDFQATVKKEYLPYFVQGEDITIGHVELYAVEDKELLPGLANDLNNGLNVGDLTTTLQDNSEFEISLTEDGVLKRDKNAQVFLLFRYAIG